MAAAASCKLEQKPRGEAPPAGAPPAFGTSPEVGPRVSTATFAEAEKLVQFELKPDERQQAASSWRKTMAALYERRAGPRKFAPDAPVAPAVRIVGKLDKGGTAKACLRVARDTPGTANVA